MNNIDNIDNTILQSLLVNPTYFTKVFSHLQTEHFASVENQEIFKIVKKYYSDYQVIPKAKEVGIKLKELKPEKYQVSVISHFKEVMKSERVDNLEFLITESQNYVQKQEFIRAILKGADDVRDNRDLGESYNLMTEALKINFDANVGMEYSDLDRRLNYYKQNVLGYNSGVKSLDNIFGGFRNKTLNVIGSVSHGGKSLFMASCASSLVLEGKNVLFLTLEMSEEETAKRIDANVLNIDINTFKSTPDEVFHNSYNSIKNNLGKLIVKEYPAGAFDVLKLEALLNELRNEKKLDFDIIFIDYLTLMKSIRATPSIGTYQYYKLIAEELHGFAKRFNKPIVTAAQLNRGAYGNKDAGIESIADSLGIAQTADVFFSIIRSKEMNELNQVLITMQKNRNTGNFSPVILGVDYPHMRYYDISSDDIQANITPEEMASFNMFDSLGTMDEPW